MLWHEHSAQEIINAKLRIINSAASHMKHPVLTLLIKAGAIPKPVYQVWVTTSARLLCTT